MSELNYITEMLELKDNNIKFYENCYYKEKIKGIFHKIFEEILNILPKLTIDDLCLSTPGFDIRSMQHETLYSRLYMS